MARSAYPVSTQQSAVSLAYRNEALIADEVCPRVSVESESFTYQKQTREDGFTVPDTRMGRASNATEVTFSGTETPAKTEDYGLDAPVPVKDIENAKSNKPLDNATLFTTDLLALGREARVAALYTTLANFPTAQRATLTGTGQWSDPASDPLKAMMLAMDAMLVRPTIAVMGQDVFTQIQFHAKVLSQVLGSTSASFPSADQIAQKLGLKKVYVGQGWLNTAKPGQAAVMARVWGKDCALLCINPLANTDRGLTFGLTAENGNREVSIHDEPRRGIRGTKVVHVVEQLKELIVASDAGYLFKAAVA